MAQVVVIGGGYGGIAAARALDEVADVVLVEPKDRFAHNVAALRGLVDPTWARRMFLPYGRLLRTGTVRRDRATSVDAGHVELASGGSIEPDFVVLATGSGYPFPGKVPDDEAESAIASLARARQELQQVGSVLLVGAGPVGLELAGEIRARWPGLAITIVDRNTDVLPGPYPEAVRAEVRRQLDALRVDIVLGASLTADPAAEPGRYRPFTVTTDSGRELRADLWFRCFGVSPVSGYLTGSLATARRADGTIAVGPDLRVAGQRTVFAIGDVTDVPEAKMAKRAELHAAVVTANIAAAIAGRDSTATYVPAPAGLSLPLGPAGGVSYREDVGVLGPEQTVALKGADLRIEVYRSALGLTDESAIDSTLGSATRA